MRVYVPLVGLAEYEERGAEEILHSHTDRLIEERHHLAHRHVARARDILQPQTVIYRDNVVAVVVHKLEIWNILFVVALAAGEASAEDKDHTRALSLDVGHIVVKKERVGILDGIQKRLFSGCGRRRAQSRRKRQQR